MKKIFYCIVFSWFSWVHAGAYDDFFRAIKQDDGRAVTQLIARGFDANSPNPNGDYGLTLAIREPSMKVVDALLSWDKLKVEVRNSSDESPLMMAALDGHLKLAQRLIERGADINKPGWAPLHYAATNGHLELMQLLLDGHAYIDASSPNGTTPLMMAAKYGTFEAVKLLLDAGADATVKNALGLTALDFAQAGSRPDAIKTLSAVAKSAAGK